MKATTRHRGLPDDQLELYMREARSHALLTPEEEKEALRKLVEARNRWLRAFLHTESGLRAVWNDLERWKAGEIAALSLIAGPPRPADEKEGPTHFIMRLHAIFSRHVARYDRRPFRGIRATAKLVRAILHVGFRPGPFDRYRRATTSKSSARTKARIQRARRRFIQVRAPLIEKNLRLAMKVARRFVPGPMPYSELIQEGNLGLIRSTESFHPRFGVRFSTYAYLWIRQAILRALENKSRTIRLPVSLTQALRRLEKEQAQAASDPGEQGVPTGSLSNPSVSRPILSLDHSLDDDTTLSQIIPDRASPGPDLLPQARDTGAFIRSSLAALPDRQRLILRLRFGIDGTRAHTLTEIGHLLGVSAERIRQLQKQAFENLLEGPDAGLLRQLSLD